MNSHHLDRQTFDKGIDFLCTAYGVSSDTSRNDTYWPLLKHLKTDDYRKAVTSAAVKEDRFPNPAKLLTYVPVKPVRSELPAYNSRQWSGYDAGRLKLCLDIMDRGMSPGVIADRLEEINNRYRDDHNRRDSWHTVNIEIREYRE